MIPELGHFALVVALFVGWRWPRCRSSARRAATWPGWQLARPATQAQFVFVAIAFGCLMTSFINNDFSVSTWRRNSNSAAAGLPHRRHLGQPRRVDAAVGLHAQRLDAWR
jgi:cytochrome c-type biogenesis protein CcmF